MLSLCPGAVVISWSAADVGFGEITYRLNKGKIEEDAEGMNDEFVQAVIDKVLDLHKKNELKIELSTGDELIPNMLRRVRSEATFNKKKKKK